jgi:hypothetical protein
METLFAPATGVGELFSLFGPRYRLEHKLPAQYRKTMFALQYCRTSMLGGHIDQCNHCGHQRIFYNSCRNRHCPKCQGLNRTKWIDKLSSFLLPVGYFHIVFTIPSELNRLVLVNQKCLYGILFKAASESLLMLAKDQKYLHANTGLVTVLHTWGQNLMDHPHLHTIVPAGGWNETAQCWQPSRKKFFIPVKIISAVFKGKFLALLKAAYNNKQLNFEGETKPLHLKNNFRDLLGMLYGKPWVVYAKKPFKDAGHIINYLGRYTQRVAISNDRIIGTKGDNVILKWKDYRNGAINKTMALDGCEFIRRFLLHVLPKGFCKIRYFGIFASRTRKPMLAKCRTALRNVAFKSKFTGLSWQSALLLATGMDITLCPVCKSGQMEMILMFNSYRSPP